MKKRRLEYEYEYEVNDDAYWCPISPEALVNINERFKLKPITSICGLWPDRRNRSGQLLYPELIDITVSHVQPRSDRAGGILETASWMQKLMNHSASPHWKGVWIQPAPAPIPFIRPLFGLRQNAFPLVAVNESGRIAFFVNGGTYNHQQVLALVDVDGAMYKAFMFREFNIITDVGPEEVEIEKLPAELLNGTIVRVKMPSRKGLELIETERQLAAFLHTAHTRRPNFSAIWDLS